MRLGTIRFHYVTVFVETLSCFGHFQKLGFLVSVSMEGRFLKCFRVLQTFRRADFRDKQRFQATTNGMSRDYSTTYPICGVLRPGSSAKSVGEFRLG
jgi:hypothetical protein